MKKIKMIAALLSSPWLPTTMIFIGALVAAVGGLLANYQQSDFNDELRQKDEKIIQLQEESIQTLKGSQACLFWMDKNNPNEKGEYPLMSQNISDHPVYDVYISIRSHVDHPADTPANLAKYLYYLQNATRHEVGTVPIGLKQTNIFLKPGYYEIKIRTRYARLTEMLRFGPFDKGFGQSYVLGDDSKSKIIQKHTTPDEYPKIYP